MSAQYDSATASSELSGIDKKPVHPLHRSTYRVPTLRAAGSILSCLLLTVVVTACSKQSADGDRATAATPASTQAATPTAQPPPQPATAVAATAFPSDSNPCHRIEEEEDLSGVWPPIPKCTNVLMEKFGNFIQYTAQPPTIRNSGDESGKEAKVYLSIKANSGSVISYRYMSMEGSGDGEDDYAFDPAPVAVYEPLNLMLVRVVQYGEEVTYDLIDLDTGKKTELGSVDLPIQFSPDSRRFFALNTEFGAALPLSVSIYRVESGVVTRESVIENKTWSPFDPRWVGADRIEFTGATDANMQWDNGKGSSTGPRLLYVFEGGKWQLQPKPAPTH